MKTKSTTKKRKADTARILNKSVEEELLHFIECYSAARLGRNLRNLLIESMLYDGGLESPYFRDLLFDLLGLYDLLDSIERDQRGTDPISVSPRPAQSTSG